MKIAITLAKSTVLPGLLFTNGMLQNAKFLYDMLLLMKHEPFFLVFNDSEEDQPLDNPDLITIGEQTYHYQTVLDFEQGDEPVDLTLEVCMTVGHALRKQLREVHGSRIVTVRYGNGLVLDTEDILFNNHGGYRNISYLTDMVWYSPHFERARTYFEAIYNAPAAQCPYLWEPNFVEGEFQQDYDHTQAPELVIMEPNINVVKTMVIPICIANKLYKEQADSFSKLWILNAAHIREKEFFINNFVENLPVLQGDKNKSYFSARVSFEDAFPQKRILIGHHWENELNYLYCEALYKGVPLVHNSECMSEVGHYYSLSDIEQGADALKQAIKEFDSNDVNRNREFLYRYSIHNPQVQAGYQTLIDKVLALP